MVSARGKQIQKTGEKDLLKFSAFILGSASLPKCSYRLCDCTLSERAGTAWVSKLNLAHTAKRFFDQHILFSVNIHKKKHSVKMNLLETKYI